MPWCHTRNYLWLYPHPETARFKDSTSEISTELGSEIIDPVCVPTQARCITENSFPALQKGGRLLYII